MTLMWQEIMEEPKVLRDCMKLNKGTIEEIVTCLKESDIQNVIIAARGTSSHAGIYAKYAMGIKLGIPVSLAPPSVFTLYNKELNMKKSLVIGISQSGKAADVLEVLKSANKQGAPTISITNYEDSPLAQESKFHLFCAAGPEKSVAATKTFTSQVFLLAQLVAFWADDEQFKRELSEVPGLLETTFENAEQIRKAVERYRFMSDCFVLARGLNYPIALETALKIQETTYVRAKAFATSDFHHGPFAMVDENTPVIIYAPKGPSLKDVKEMIAKLKTVGADCLIISNDPETLEMADCAIKIYDMENDFITPLINGSIAQLFACNLALLRGRDPDHPRGLSKVTITR